MHHRVLIGAEFLDPLGKEGKPDSGGAAPDPTPSDGSGGDPFGGRDAAADAGGEALSLPPKPDLMGLASWASGFSSAPPGMTGTGGGSSFGPPGPEGTGAGTATGQAGWSGAGTGSGFDVAAQMDAFAQRFSLRARMPRAAADSLFDRSLKAARRSETE